MTNEPLEPTIPVEMAEGLHPLEPGRMVSIPQSVARKHNLQRGSRITTHDKANNVMRDATEANLAVMRGKQ